jgi:hypothetical protein
MTELKGLFGGGEDSSASQEQRAKAQDFVQRYMQGDPSEGYSQEEAVQALQAAAKHASPEQIQRATNEAINHLNPDQRKQFDEMLKQRQAGQGFVPIERAGDAGSASGSGGGLDDVLGGLLGGNGGGGGLGGGLGAILGGLLGGSSGSQSSGGGLGDILSGMTGGQSSTQSGFQQQGGGLGDIMSSPVGKAVIGGIAAFAMKELMDQRK